MVSKVRILKNNGNAQYSFYADFRNFDDAVNYVNELTNCVTPVIDKSNYSTRYDYGQYMILVRNSSK